MEEIGDLVQGQREQQQRAQEQKALASSIGAYFPKPQPMPTPQVNVTTPKHENSISLNLQGVEHITTDTVTITGLEETLSEIKDWVIEAQKLIKKIDFQPSFKVPTPKITVDVPPVKMPDITIPPTVVNVDTSKLEKIIKDMKPIVIQSPTGGSRTAPRIAEERELYADGKYDGYEITYEGGSTERVTGYARGRVKHEYK